MDFTVIAEANGDSLHPTTYQLIGAAASMGSNPTVICPNGTGAEEAATINGVEKVISVNGDCFNIFDGGAWASSLSSLCGDIILISASPNGREIGSRIAAKKDIPVIQDVTSMTEGITVSRPIYSGKAMESLTVTGSAVITLRPNSFEAALAENNAPINVVDQSADVKISIQEAINKASERLDVTEPSLSICQYKKIHFLQLHGEFPLQELFLQGDLLLDLNQ